MKTILTLVAGLALTGFAAPAAAQETRSVAVRVGDLNLASAAGIRAVESRIEAAARRVCGGPFDVRNRADVRSYESCRTAALAAAMDALQARKAPLYATR